MRRPSSDRLAAAGFVVSLSLLAMLYGTVSSWWGWFPAPQIGLAHRTLMELGRNWRNDFALEPTRHLVAPGPEGTAPDPERGLAVHAPQQKQPGLVLVAGLNEDEDGPFHVVRLYDGAGEEVHRWPVRYELLDEEKRPQNVMLHGMEVFEDGSLAVIFDAGNTVARIDACGEPMWQHEGAYHHSLQRDGEGALVTWRGEAVVWLDEETGEELRVLDLHEDVIAAADGAQQGYLDLRTRTPENAREEMRYLADPFHPNDAEPLTAELAPAFPMFEAGDVMLSLRELNMVAVVDPETGMMRWWRHGPWIKQHDPDFQPDGTITVYDNGTGTGSSKIIRVDPAPDLGDDALTTEFAGTEAVPFYSWRRGKHQYLPNGNVLLSEPEHGRVLEVSPSGEVVWERHMPWDAERNVIVTEARHVPEDFFADGVPSCTSEVAAADPPRAGNARP